MKKLSLLLTLAENHELHEAMDSSRPKSKVVSVPREALMHLLLDHNRLLDLHSGNLNLESDS